MLGGASLSYSQVATLPLEEYTNLKSERDSLKKGWNVYKLEAAEQERLSNLKIDSLIRGTQILLKEKQGIVSSKKSVESAYEQLKKEFDSLKADLTLATKNIEELNLKLEKKALDIATLNKEKLESENKKYNQGKRDALDAIYNAYAALDFDEMILSSSEKQVRRDIKLVENKNLKNKLADLESYFKAKKALEEKYNNNLVTNSLNQLNKFKVQSKLVSNLLDNLDNYQIRNEGLQDAIRKIQELDNRFIANTENDQIEKEGDILTLIAWYFYNYDFNNLSDYPYLSSIIIEIMQVKHKDANADISNILNKL